MTHPSARLGLFAMRASPLVALAALLAAAPATAQTDSTAAPRRSWWKPVSRSLTVGVARNGPAVRLGTNGGAVAISDRISVGLLSRGVVSRGAYDAPDGSVAGNPRDVYLEATLGLRPAVQVTERLEVAASVGVGGATLFAGEEPDGYIPSPFANAVMVVPVEAEVTARLGRSVGLALTASRSTIQKSLACDVIASSADRASCSGGPGAANWTTTVGLRFGR